MRPQFSTTPHRILLLLLAAVALAGWRMALPNASGAVAPQFEVLIAPALPAAGERVTVSVLASNFFASSTIFTWFRDNAALPTVSGVGRSGISFATNPAASETRVRVEVNPGAGFNRAEREVLITAIPNLKQREQELSEAGTAFGLQASDVNPNAGESVTVEVVTFAFDRTQALYQWHVNGVLDPAASGRGQWSISVAAPAEGAAKTIRVDALTPSGSNSQSITLRTISAPLYWWADTTAPYWYRGKALPSRNGEVTVLALPGVPNPQQLSYGWSFNSARIPRASGFGKQTFSFPMTLPVSEEISVTISDGGTVAKSSAIRIQPVSPRISVYEQRPLRGVVYERELAEFRAAAGEPYDFLAAPFFFPRTAAAGLKYRWMLNGQEIQGTFDAPWLFTLESSSGEASANELSLEVTDPQPRGERAFKLFRANLR